MTSPILSSCCRAAVSRWAVLCFARLFSRPHADSKVSSLLHPWLLPQVSSNFKLNKSVLSQFADAAAELDFLSLLVAATRSGAPETDTHVLAHALLRAAEFQSISSTIW